MDQFITNSTIALWRFQKAVRDITVAPVARRESLGAS
jgi:hypothetical protein